MKLKRIVFTLKVYSVAVAGLECTLFSESDFAALDSCLSKFGRVLFMGRACSKDGDHFRAWTNMVVLQKLRLLPTGFEVRVRRLKRLQQMVLHPSDNSLVLCALFGRMQAEGQDTLDSGGRPTEYANPWIRTLWQDVASLSDLDD